MGLTTWKRGRRLLALVPFVTWYVCVAFLALSWIEIPSIRVWGVVGTGVASGALLASAVWVGLTDMRRTNRLAAVTPQSVARGWHA